MQAVITKFLGPTNTRGARIKVTSWLGSSTYSYDYEAALPHEEAFIQWLAETNKRMAKKYDCVGDEPWFKAVAKGNSPDGTGYVFIVK